MLHGVFGVFRQSIDLGLNLVDPRFSFFLRALYPEEPSWALVEFLQTRFKNIKAGFYRYKPLLMDSFPSCEFILIAHLRLLEAKGRLAPYCSIRHDASP
ncbi:hypothetical protein GW17_00046893 [Ensete ventricosum]|nr:hypothetical protein GW17_00046893 [Ensete ventricosum]